MFPSTTSILDATKITLENNISIFDNIAFIQKDGTAMGPNNAYSYADIAMHPIDLIIIIIIKTISFPCGVGLKMYIFSPWVMGMDKLHEFLAWLNTLHP